ncbi:hypothetical protein ACFL31_02240 [Candidatus Margulisiibacteriota bacterium]
MGVSTPLVRLGARVRFVDNLLDRGGKLLKWHTGLSRRLTEMADAMNRPGDEPIGAIKNYGDWGRNPLRTVLTGDEVISLERNTPDEWVAFAREALKIAEEGRVRRSTKEIDGRIRSIVQVLVTKTKSAGELKAYRKAVVTMMDDYVRRNLTFSNSHNLLMTLIERAESPQDLLERHAVSLQLLESYFSIFPGEDLQSYEAVIQDPGGANLRGYAAQLADNAKEHVDSSSGPYRHLALYLEVLLPTIIETSSSFEVLRARHSRVRELIAANQEMTPAGLLIIICQDIGIPVEVLKYSLPLGQQAGAVGQQLDLRPEPMPRTPGLAVTLRSQIEALRTSERFPPSKVLIDLSGVVTGAELAEALGIESGELMSSSSLCGQRTSRGNAYWVKQTTEVDLDNPQDRAMVLAVARANNLTLDFLYPRV